MIALNPPLPGWIDEEAEHVLVLAIDRSAAVCANETGHLILRSLASLQVDIRYENAGDRWYFGGLDAEEETDDVGPEVSGLFSEADRERDGDPSLEGD